MGIWVEIDIGSGNRVQILGDGSVLWEHDALPGYKVTRHTVAPVDRATWTVVQREPLTITPSLFCDPGRGGCGMHGWVRDGAWVSA